MEDREKLKEAINDLNKEYSHQFVIQYNNGGIINKTPKTMNLIIEVLQWVLENCFDANGKFKIPFIKLLSLRNIIKKFIKKL